MRQDEELQQQYEVLAHIWKENHNNIDDQDNINVQNALYRIINRAASETDQADFFAIQKKRKNRRRITLLSFLSLIVVIAGWFWISREPGVIARELAQEPIIANYGSRSRSLLPDGTTVWLNAGSKLHYENDFNGTTREVRLEGEAFFDVVKQADRPFIVHTSGIDIRVLGTAFNVKSYPEDTTVETTLYRGLVQVSREEDIIKKQIQLKPNEKLILLKQAAKEEKKLSLINASPAMKAPQNFIITHIDSTKKESERFETAWLYSRLEFRGNSFEELALKLERWYNVTIVFADDRVKKLSVTGILESETVEQAFVALKEAFPINYKINNQDILVSSSQ